MIDIHCHILPGVDDGPKDWDEALSLVRAAADDGVTGMVSTSHVVDRLDASTERLYRDLFDELVARVRDAGIPMRLWLAGEIHCQTAFDPASPLATFGANGKYALVELPMGQIPPDVNDLFFRLEIEGVTPILAHPERNGPLAQSPQKVQDLVRRGVLMQVNAGSLMGRFGRGARQAAETLMDHNLVHFMASDAHNTGSRPPTLSDARDEVVRRWGEERARRLFIDHPLAAAEGRDIEPEEPLPLAPKRRGWLSRLKVTS